MRLLMQKRRGMKRFPVIAGWCWLTACAPAEPPPVRSPASEPTATAPSASAAIAPTPAPAAASAAEPTPFPVSPAVAAAFAATDRSADDRALDAGRKADQLLSFCGVAPGMRVAELAAGGGYTAELLARVVGSTGRVYGQNAKFFLERFAEKPWTERLAKPVMRNVTRVDREFDDPLPPEAKDLDVVMFVLFYHDTVWHGTDRDRMNRAVLAALRPGGVYCVVDHSGRDGTGTSETETLHRIEERVLRGEIERGGFVLDATASFLKNPGDARDWSASPRVAAERRGTSDRFALRFEKPPAK
jgi:predicted methyltransferase